MIELQKCGNHTRVGTHLVDDLFVTAQAEFLACGDFASVIALEDSNRLFLFGHTPTDGLDPKMDVDGDGGRREFGLRGQRRGTESDKGTAANSPSGYHAPGLKRFWLVCGLGHEITKLGVKLLCEPWSRNALVVAHYLVNPNLTPSFPRYLAYRTENERR
jgi:hypothetical protein